MVKLLVLILVGMFFVSELIACEMDKKKTLWLSIITAQKTLPDAYAEFKRLGGQDKGLNILSTNDCTGLVPGLFIAAQTAQSRSEALALVDVWRDRGEMDTYAKKCDVVASSRLAFGVPLLDASLYAKKSAAVNWDLSDAVSRLKQLSSTKTAIIRPKYQEDPNDVREGLKIQVFLHDAGKSDSMKKLSADCIQPEFSLDKEYLALACVTETAATHMLHSTSVYRLPQVTLVHTHNRCGNPKIASDKLICTQKSVDVEGELVTHEKTFFLAR